MPTALAYETCEVCAETRVCGNFGTKAARGGSDDDGDLYVCALCLSKRTSTAAALLPGVSIIGHGAHAAACHCSVCGDGDGGGVFCYGIVIRHEPGKTYANPGASVDPYAKRGHICLKCVAVMGAARDYVAPTEGGESSDTSDME